MVFVVCVMVDLALILLMSIVFVAEISASKQTSTKVSELLQMIWQSRQQTHPHMIICVDKMRKTAGLQRPADFIRREARCTTTHAMAV